MSLPLKKHIIKFASSLKLAVGIMAYLAAWIAWGTIVESKYDAEAAKKTVYDTPMMLIGMAMLATSLIAVMVDRWPWKKKHIPFILAHIGILILLFGSVLTMKYGLDGSMTVDIGGQSGSVVLPQETDVVVYASFGGGMTRYSEQAVDFFRYPPTPDKPLSIPTDAGPIELVDYRKYVLPSKKVAASDQEWAGAGVRFQMTNERANVIEWLVQKNKQTSADIDLGPAQVHLGPTPSEGRGKNEIWLEAQGDRLKWTLFRKDQNKAANSGVVEEGGRIQTGWMGLEFKILRYHPKAQEQWDFDERETPTPLTTSAVKVRFRGREQWLLLNDTLRLFTDSAAYLVNYMNRRVDLGFPLKLKKFEMIPYEGTRKAKEYRSIVELPEAGETVISMNEPAHFNGLTFYQASFQNNDKGEPVASVFSVNHDPGRWWKYLGSLVITLGVVWLFWSRRKTRTAG